MMRGRQDFAGGPMGGGQNLCGRHRGYEIGDENFVGVGH